MIRPLTCPICDKELPANAGTKLQSFPFCSEQCRQIDLYRWSEGKYSIVEELPPEMLEYPELLDELRRREETE